MFVCVLLQCILLKRRGGNLDRYTERALISLLVYLTIKKTLSHMLLLQELCTGDFSNLNDAARIKQACTPTLNTRDISYISIDITFGLPYFATSKHGPLCISCHNILMRTSWQCVGRIIFNRPEEVILTNLFCSIYSSVASYLFSFGVFFFLNWCTKLLERY